jgi:hypothetical protein
MPGNSLLSSVLHLVGSRCRTIMIGIALIIVCTGLYLFPARQIWEKWAVESSVGIMVSSTIIFLICLHLEFSLFFCIPCTVLDVSTWAAGPF